MKDNEGQLLLLAVIFLAITLIVLASAATVFLNVRQNQINGSLAVEYGNVKEKFGFALNDNLNKNYVNSTDETKNQTIRKAFNITLGQFDHLLTFHGMSINITLINITGLTYSTGDTVEVNISFKIEKGNSFVSEMKCFRFKVSQEGVKSKYVHPDASADETVTEGDAEGIWDPDGISAVGTDDGITRNITEVGGTWTEYATTSGTPGGFTDHENVRGPPDNMYAWDHLEDQQGVYGSGYATHTGTITSVIIKAEYHATDVGINDPFRLKYSLDGGSNWGIYEDITPPLSTTDVEVTLNITSDDSVNGGSWDWTDILNLQIYIYGRFTAGPDGNDVYVDALYCTINSSGDYSLNTSYVLDGSLSGYDIYSLTVKANTSGTSIEKFNVTYQIDDAGEWYVLGTIEGTTEQELSVILTVSPKTKVVVRFVDTGTIPGPNTLQINFIELYCRD